MSIQSLLFCFFIVCLYFYGSNAAELRSISNSPLNCNPTEYQFNCAGEITAKLFGGPPQGCDAVFKINVNPQTTAYGCVKCGNSGPYSFNPNSCPYLKCGNSALCGSVMGFKLTPNQMKCLVDTGNPGVCL